MSVFQHIHVIANPAAGQDKPVLSTLNRIFQEHGATWSIDITQKKGDGARLAKKAVEEGVDLIVAYGGDGTVGDVAGGMLNSSVPLAILPGGTANALAQGLGIVPTLEEATEQIFDSQPDFMDLGQANDEIFILRADVGLTLEAQATREMKDRLGVLAYIAASVQALGQPQKATYHLKIDDKEIDFEGIACIVTNHTELGALGLKFSPKVQHGDGLLDLFLVDEVGNALAAVASVLVSLTDDSSAYLQHWQARTIEIVSDPPQMVGLDGDPFENTPVKIKVLPKAIRVLTPIPERV